MAHTRMVVRRLLCAAGVAAALAGAVVTAPSALAQPSCNSGIPNQPPPPTCVPNNGTPPGAPNLESGGGVDQQQHSGDHH